MLLAELDIYCLLLLNSVTSILPVQ